MTDSELVAWVLDLQRSVINAGHRLQNGSRTAGAQYPRLWDLLRLLNPVVEDVHGPVGTKLLRERRLELLGILLNRPNLTTSKALTIAEVEGVLDHIVQEYRISAQAWRCLRALMKNREARVELMATRQLIQHPG